MLGSKEIELSHEREGLYCHRQWTYESLLKKPDGFVIVVLTLFSV